MQLTQRTSADQSAVTGNMQCNRNSDSGRFDSLQQATFDDVPALEVRTRLMTRRTKDAAASRQVERQGARELGQSANRVAV